MSTLFPTHILSALDSAENEWPALIGEEDWPIVEARYHELRAQLEGATGPAQMLAAVEVVEMFAPYDAARKKLNEAITAQTEIGAILIGLAEVAVQLQLDSAVSMRFKEAAQPGSSQRFIWQSSPTKATSIKLGNLSFEFGALSELITGVIATASKDILGEADVILKAAGVLLLISNLYKATAIKLDEREATVFCGFAKAGREAKEEVILAHANRVRRGISLKPLNRQELGNALHKLAEIKSVARVEGSSNKWRIIEQHTVK